MTQHVESAQSIPDMVRRGAELFGDAVAVVDGDLAWTYRELETAMLDAARGFAHLGIEPGDRVALCGPNSARWIQAALGIHAVGGVLVPLNTRFKGEEMRHILHTSDAAALVTVGHFLGNDYVTMVREADPSLRALERIVLLDDAWAAGALTFGETVEAGLRAVTEEQAIERLARVSPGDLADIMFTSGTSGAPKGVMIGHGQSLRAYTAAGVNFTLTSDDVSLIVPPFFHGFGYKGGWLMTLIFGATVVPQLTFDIDEILARIEQLGVSNLQGPPTIFNELINHPRLSEHDISSLRVSVVSAATIPADLIRAMRDVLGFDIVLSAYGLTESTAIVALSAPDDDVDHVVNTVGRPIAGLEVRICDAAGRALPAGESGEIWVRGYTVMRGYWNDPVATAAAITPEGWLRTGDIGSLDADGYLTIADRMKDMFIVGGFNVYPAEVESALRGHDAIRDVAVVGAPDPRMGEVGVAFVEPRDGVTLTEQEVVDFARERLANYKVPRRVVVVEGLPRNSSLKVTKTVLKQQAADLVAGDRSATA